GVAGEDAPEPGVAVDLLLRGAGVAGAEAAPAVLGRRGQGRLEVAVVLSGPVLAPDLRVHRVLGHLDQAHERLASLLLALEDVGQKGQEQDGETRHAQEAQDQPPGPRRCRPNAFTHVAPSLSAAAVARAGVA